MSGSEGPVAGTGIPVANAWYLLLYAWDLARWQGRFASVAETSPGLLGLLARVLVEATDELFARQLGRAHLRRTEEIPGVRGRVDISRSLSRLSFSSGRAVCSYPELSVDTLPNRILRSTMARLVASAELEAGAVAEASAEVRHRLRSAVAAMQGVRLYDVRPTDFRRLQLGRNDSAYVLPLAICALIVRYESPSEAEGHGTFARLLRDEVAFDRLFERFVRNFYRAHLPACGVKSEELSWFDELGSDRMPRMLTDVTIEWKVPRPRRLVVDTKYYAEALASRFGAVAKFRSGHLYQLYAYLRTQEHRGGIHGNAEGMLLYPTVDIELEDPIRVQGHSVKVATVDLARPWQEIEERLLRLVGEADR